MEIIIYLIIYCFGLGLSWKILEEADDWDDYEGLCLFFTIIWPISLLVLIGNKVGKKVSKYFTVIFMLLFFSCSPDIHSCKYKIKQIEKNSNLSGKQLAKRMK